VDIKLGLSILNKPWLVEHSAAMQMLDFWDSIKSGGNWNYQEAVGKKGDNSIYAITQNLFSQSSISVAPQSTGEMQGFKGFDGSLIAIIPISGPLMKSDYCGALGTASLRQLTQMAANTASVRSIIFIIDSPGGTVDGTQSFADTIKSTGKQTIAYVDGMMCSAAYWIGSCCDKIFASTNTDIIGSIGTMCSLTDNTEAMKARGMVLREYYATASTDKNKMFSDAKGGDGKALIAEMLDPMNDMFLSTVQSNRVGLNKETLTGKTYLSDKAQSLGLIDGIHSFEQVISSVGYAYSPQTNSKATIKNIVMTTADVKANSEVYNALKAEILSDEKDRIGAFAEYKGIDAAACLDEIVAGNKFSQTFAAKMSVKAMSAQGLKNIAGANAPDVNTPDPAAEKTEDVKKVEAFEKGMKADLAARFGITAQA